MFSPLISVLCFSSSLQAFVILFYQFASRIAYILSSLPSLSLTHSLPSPHPFPSLKFPSLCFTLPSISSFSFLFLYFSNLYPLPFLVFALPFIYLPRSFVYSFLSSRLFLSPHFLTPYQTFRCSCFSHSLVQCYISPLPVLSLTLLASSLRLYSLLM